MLNGKSFWIEKFQALLHICVRLCTKHSIATIQVLSMHKKLDHIYLISFHFLNIYTYIDDKCVVFISKIYDKISAATLIYCSRKTALSFEILSFSTAIERNNNDEERKWR